MIELNKLYNEDCLGENGIRLIPDKSIGMILCDLPFGQTRLGWDSVIPLDELWEQYKRIIKYDGAIVLFGQQPFTSKLLLSNSEMFKYELIWEKTRSPHFAHSKYRVMGIHENILIFSNASSTYTKDPNKRMKYNPQMEEGEEYTISKKAHGKVAGNAKIQNHENWEGKTNKGRYPKSIRKVANPAKGTVHPTQKPVDLFEWLVRTFTDENDVVLDNCMGSGTTAIAAINTNRNYIGFELEKEYYDIALERIKLHNENKLIHN